MEKVFICSAFRGDVEENIRKAREYCRWAAMERGAIPIAPHLLFPQFLDDNDPKQREIGIEMGLELLAGCRRLFLFRGHHGRDVEGDWESPCAGDPRGIRPGRNMHVRSDENGRNGNTDLKECYIVRYADDFKIFCRNRKDAENMFTATKSWLKERLCLDISPDKSKIVNLKKHYSEFLGFKMKVVRKGKKANGQAKYAVRSHMSDKSKARIKKQAVEAVRDIKHLMAI